MTVYMYSTVQFDHVYISFMHLKITLSLKLKDKGTLITKIVSVCGAVLAKTLTNLVS